MNLKPLEELQAYLALNWRTLDMFTYLEIDGYTAAEEDGLTAKNVARLILNEEQGRADLMMLLVLLHADSMPMMRLTPPNVIDRTIKLLGILPSQVDRLNYVPLWPLEYSEPFYQASKNNDKRMMGVITEYRIHSFMLTDNIR